jgi:hypothetical protein
MRKTRLWRVVRSAGGPVPVRQAVSRCDGPTQSGAITNAAPRLDTKKNPVDLAFPVTQRSQYRMC